MSYHFSPSLFLRHTLSCPEHIFGLLMLLESGLRSQRENKLAKVFFFAPDCLFLTFDWMVSVVLFVETLLTFLNCWRCFRPHVGDTDFLCRNCFCMMQAGNLPPSSFYTYKFVTNNWIICLFQEKYNLNVCSLFYGTAILYNGQEERHKHRYV